MSQPPLFALSLLSAVPDKKLTSAKYQNLDLLIYRDGSSVQVIQNFCPHMGFPLNNSIVEQQTLKCIHHNFKFSLTDGSCLTRGAICDQLRVAQAQIENNQICIEEYKLADWL